MASGLTFLRIKGSITYMLPLPDRYITVAQRTYPSSATFSLNLATQGALGCGDSSWTEWAIEDIFCNDFRHLAVDRLTIESYLTEHYVPCGAFWINPRTIIYAQHDKDDFTLRSIGGCQLTCPRYDRDTIARLVAAGFAQTADNAAVSLDRVDELDSRTGKMIVRDQWGRSLDPALRIRGKFLDQVLLTLATAEWRRLPGGVWLNPRSLKPIVVAKPFVVTKADLKSHRVFTGGVGGGRVRKVRIRY